MDTKVVLYFQHKNTSELVSLTLTVCPVVTIVLHLLVTPVHSARAGHAMSCTLDNLSTVPL